MNKFVVSQLVAAATAITLESHLDCQHDKLPLLAQVGTTVAQNTQWISTEWSDPITLNFKNMSDETVQLWWYDYSGNPQPYGQIWPGSSYRQGTYATHPWQARGVNNYESQFTVDQEEVYVPDEWDNEKTLIITKVLVEDIEPEQEVFRSTAWSTAITLKFYNETDSYVQVYWHGYDGNLYYYSTIAPGAEVTQQTYATHPWSATDTYGSEVLFGGERVFVGQSDDDDQRIVIGTGGAESEEDQAVDPVDEDVEEEEGELGHCFDHTDNNPNGTVSGHHGTIFLNEDWVLENADSAFDSLGEGQSCQHTAYDRRPNRWVYQKFWCFEATFETGLEPIRVQVNRDDFQDQTDAEEQAQTYANAVGRVPKLLRRDVKTITIHAGVEPFGGGNNDILIHTGQAETVYAAWKNLEETLIHEASHTSLDGHLYGTTRWQDAVEADGKFSSNYARDNPNREDIAETYLVWFATKYARETMQEQDLQDWECFMENRFKVFEEDSCQPGNMSPWPDC